MTSLEQAINKLDKEQNEQWELLKNNTIALKNICSRKIDFPGFSIYMQFNPARIVSAVAKTDTRSIKDRPCFLCRENRPDIQKEISFGQDYDILLNPYPIFPGHLTIAHKRHVPQRIKGKVKDLLALCYELPGYDLLYNGPESGASAPDHFHFQAIYKNEVPLFSDLSVIDAVCRKDNILFFDSTAYLRSACLIEGAEPERVCSGFEYLYKLQEKIQADKIEPMMNVWATFDKGMYRIVIFPRQAHRPSFYYETGEKQLIVSPGAIDFAGVFIIPREVDFNKIDRVIIEDIFIQLSLPVAELICEQKSGIF